MKHYTLLLIAIFIGTASFAQSQMDGILGDWYNQEKNTVIHIYKKGNAFFGKITWLKEPLDKNGKAKTDPLNDDESLRSRKRQGMVIMYGFEYNSNSKWNEGSIYDPKSGNEYSGTMTLVSKNELDLRGYVGFSWFGRTANWTRKVK